MKVWGVLVVNSIIDKKKLDIEGVILVAPAIWNFSEKKIFLKALF